MAYAQMPVKARFSVAAPVRVTACAAKRGDNFDMAQAAIVSSLAFSLSAPAAQAADVDSAVDATIQTVQTIGELLKGAYSAAEGAAQVAGETYDRFSPQISSAIEQAAPVVKQGVDEVSKVAVPAFNQAIPVVQSTTKSLLESSGLDLKAVTSTTNTAVSTAADAYKTATPTINKVVNFLTTTQPEDLGKGAIALVAAYFLLPVFLKGIFGSLRGYSGELSPAKAVDIVSQNDSAVLIDLRSLKEKSAVGVPDVPSNARGRFVELESAEIERRLRGQLKNADSVETQITALEIQALKRVSKGSTVILLDKSGNQSKAVAKDLCRLGFGSVYTVAGGFSGWTASKLQIRPPVPGVAQPMGVLPNIIGTVSTRVNGTLAGKKKFASSK